MQGLTGHYLIHEYRQIRRSDWVLVHAAAGGVGSLLVQWAKHLQARVIGTASTPEKAKFALDAGADHVVLYTRQDLAAETRRLTDGHGADLILDAAGKSTFQSDLEAVALRGQIVVFGASSGPAEPVSPVAFMAKSISVGGSLGNFIASRDELLRRANDTI